MVQNVSLYTINAMTKRVIAKGKLKRAGDGGRPVRVGEQ